MKRKILSVILIAVLSISGLLAVNHETAFADEITSKATEPTAEEAVEPEVPLFRDEVPVIHTAHSGAAIRISWEAIDGATGYRLYRYYDGGKKTRIADTEKLYFSDKKVASGKNATYYVVAYNATETTQASETVSNIIYRVYIETGHGRRNNGKWDPGCKWSKYQEAKLMIPIAKAMTKYLRANGVYVYTDAESGNNHNLNWTLSFLDQHSVSAFVNIHCDYYKAKPGTLPLYRTAGQKKLAAALNKGVHSTVNIRNRGLQKRTDLETLKSKKVHCTACLFETGSIKRDNKLLRTKYDAYGKGLAKGLCSYLKIDFNDR